MMPDYSLYPDIDYDLGFTTRGCIRNCPFCFVPRKEGKFKIHQHPSEFHDPKHRKIRLLDNNLTQDKTWFFTVTDWIMENDLQVEFNQGLDARLIDKEIQERIAELRLWGTLHLAFDSMNYKDDVLRSMELLKNAGLNLRSKLGYYVYCENDDMFDDALERCNILREHGVSQYVMLNPEYPRTKRMQDLKRWSRPIFYYRSDFESYQRYTHKRGS